MFEKKVSLLKVKNTIVKIIKNEKGHTYQKFERARAFFAGV